MPFNSNENYQKLVHIIEKETNKQTNKKKIK